MVLGNTFMFEGVTSRRIAGWKGHCLVRLARSVLKFSNG